MACCGKDICKACFKENRESINKQNEEKKAGKKLVFTCPFCREPIPTSSGEEYARLQARCLQNDHMAFTLKGYLYRRGEGGMPKDDLKALDCWIRAVELGSPDACACIAGRYTKGIEVAIDTKRVTLFTKVGALRGSLVARYNIGCLEYDLDNHEIGIRNWKIAAEAGLQESIEALKKIYNAYGKKPGKEFISKEYLDFAYRACHGAQMEEKSEEREKHSGVK